MSQYTTELRYLLQQGYELGLSDYPIFDEGYRNVLNKKIMDEYYFREIGQETPDRFRHHLNHTLNMVMPYYNQLYQSELIKIDPLITHREEETLHRTTGTDSMDTATEDQTVRRDLAANGTQTQTGTSVSDGTSSGTSVSDGTYSGTSVSDGTSSGTSLTGTDSTTKTVGTETTDEDTQNTKTEDKFSVDSDTPGGMISIGDIKNHTWASKASMGEGTVGETGSNDRTVSVDNTVTGSGDTSVESNNTAKETVESNNTAKETVTSNNAAKETAKSDASMKVGSSELENTAGKTTGSRTGSLDTVDEYLKSKLGLTGNQSKLIQEYRKTFLNIDLMIVRELNTLFMGVY